MFVLFSTSAVQAQDSTGDFSNSNSTVDSNNTSETVNYNGAGAGTASPVMTAISPTMMGGGGNDSCLVPNAVSLSLLQIGISGGGMKQDPYCNRRKNARLLGAPNVAGGLGLQVSGISVLCNDPDVFKAMILANTPCPINDIRTGSLLMGRSALLKYRENPELYVRGYKDNKAFWDSLLLVGETIEDEQTDEDNEPKRSISSMFRTTDPG